ncbi:L,D-transpeptidase [Pseudonocardia nematodicida]|uniref:L,D-transpeptidase n=1 Tax=Pseudonocardia nematodicida TaxID=1206997 RepID=A0ABV1KCV3_9PSEU
MSRFRVPSLRTVLFVVPLLLASLLATTGAATAAERTSAASAAQGTPCATSARACVRLSSGQAWLTDGAGTVTYGPVSVSGGTAAWPTPVGTFSVSHKVVDYWSRQFDAPMPYSVFFQPGIAFHQGDLGSSSAGCLRLSRASAQKFFADLKVGDTVQVLS